MPSRPNASALGLRQFLLSDDVLPCCLGDSNVLVEARPASTPVSSIAGCDVEYFVEVFTDRSSVTPQQVQNTTRSGIFALQLEDAFAVCFTCAKHDPAHAITPKHTSRHLEVMQLRRVCRVHLVHALLAIVSICARVLAPHAGAVRGLGRDA